MSRYIDAPKFLIAQLWSVLANRDLRPAYALAKKIGLKRAKDGTVVTTGKGKGVDNDLVHPKHK